MNVPRIRKSRRLIGRTLAMRDAATTDAPFIHALRTDAARSRHLSATSAALDDQVLWLQRYAAADDQAYFVIEDRHGQPQGAVRLYDARGDSFCWGSWVLKEGAPPHAAIESALMVYAYALDTLGFRAAHFDVRKANERVWRFHERFGAQRTGETALDYLYALPADRIAQARARYAKYLPDPLDVDPA
jgi:RimJ/RimL family protein N-acetyltransferase